LLIKMPVFGGKWYKIKKYFLFSNFSDGFEFFSGVSIFFETI
jgi:hypothetical protein